jgi:hypothetical protein
VRRTLTSVAVAFVGAAAVAAGGWALQAAALPSPEHADRVAADASAWLHDYRLVVDVFHIDHRRVKGACLRGWFPGPGRTTSLASVLSLGSGHVFRFTSGRRVSPGSRERDRQRPGGLMALAGCSAKLSSALASAAQSGQVLRIERGYAANQPAIALRVGRTHHERLTLYVSPKTYLPIVAVVDRGGHTATARIYLTRISPALLARWRLPRETIESPRG